MCIRDSANSFEADSTLHAFSALTPIPTNSINSVASNKEHLISSNKLNTVAPNFIIANPSQQQIDEWLAGDFSNLNKKFSGNDPKDKSGMMSKTIEFIGKARSVIQEVKKIGNFVTKLTGEDLKSLPVGMTKSLGDNTEVTIGIGSIYLYPEYANLEIFLEVSSPKLADNIFFAAPDVKFSRLGGISGVVSLGLLGDFRLPILEEKATIRFKSAMVDEAKNEFKKSQGTYAEFSCDGIETISIDANLAISRNVLLPADTNIEEPDTNRSVNADFFITTSNGISDILTEINFDQPFYHVQNPGLVWTIESATFDFSSLRHSDSLRFPVGNYDPMPTLATKENWQGVFIKKISVEWRDSIAQSNGGSETSFSVSGTNIIIDEAGFTGQISAQNIIPLSDAHQIDKWAFSIDYLAVSILTNSFESLDFNGHIGIPMTYENGETSHKKQDLINYSGSFDFAQNKYSISGNLPSDKVLPLNMFKGQIVIENTSVFTVGYDSEKIYLAANLNANFETKNNETENEDEKKLNIPLVEVSGLEISSKSPFLIKTGNWILRDTISVAKFAGFGININSLIVQKNAATMDTELIVGADINLAAGDKVNISGATVVRVTANIEDTPTKQHWKFKDVNLEMIQIEADMEAFSLSGQVVFFKNLEGGGANGQLGYGSGFQGSASLKIKGLNKKDDGGGSGFAAMALFGTTTRTNNETFRYFMVDVLGYFSGGIPIGAIGLYGVGGGVYYRMEQEDLSTSFSNVPVFDPPPGSQITPYTAYISSFLGKSLSGAKYRPSENVKIGINLNVILGATPEPKAFNANIGFNLEINDNGGINFIKLNGLMNVMSDISMDGPGCSGVSLAIEMEFIFRTSAANPQKGFYASAHAFVKVGPLIGNGNQSGIPAQYSNYIERCSGEGLGYAGSLEMQFSEDYWFLNIGEPDNRLELKVQLWKIGSISLSTYFDIGKNIPPFPGLPSNVRSLTKLGNLVQSELNRGSGRGFAFGVSFEAGLDTPEFLGFSAHVALGAGFDIMLNKFRDVNCLNSGSPEPIGVNNWYAAGQAWAYIDAAIKFKGAEVLGLGLAAALQIKGPNPTFGRGALAGRIKLGPFRKKFNVHFQFGKECEVQGSELLEQEIELVLFMTPSNDDQSVPLYTDIDIVFTQELDEPFIVTNPNTNLDENYEIRMESFVITNPAGDQINVSKEQLSKQFLRYTPIDQLRSNTEYTLTLITNLYKEEVLFETEERIHIFKTGDLPKEIFNHNVEYALPGDGQFNFYKEDSSSEYIHLKQGQEELLAELPDGHSLKIKVSTTHPASIVYSNCSYNSGMNRLNFSLPSNLVNGKSYKLEVVKVVDEDFPGFSNQDFELDEYQLPMPFPEDTIYYTMAFRVSNYNLFSDKMASAEYSNFLNDNSFTSPSITGSAKPHLVQVSNLSEPFGVEEVEGILNNNPSLIFEANLGTTSWINQHYRNYSGPETQNFDIYGYKGGDRITDYLDKDRVAYFGNREPAKGIFIVQDSIYRSQLDNIFSYNDDTNLSNIEIKIDYALGKIMSNELTEVANKLIQELNGFQSGVSELMNTNSEMVNMGMTGTNNNSNNSNPICSTIIAGDFEISDIKSCCHQNENSYEVIRDYVTSRLESGKGTLRKFAYAPSNRTMFCNFYANGVNIRKLFTDLTPGSYPVFIKYYKPSSSVPTVFNQTFTKN